VLFDFGYPREKVVNFLCKTGIAGAKLFQPFNAAVNHRNLCSHVAQAIMSRVELTDLHVPKDFREGLRKSVCAQFTTALGPGSDGSHEDHIHVDLLERRGGYRICEWDVREPGEVSPAPAFVCSVPLPRARPAIDARNRPQ
jgi:hypothetical protein